jgi:Icc-related predicted phosphoesterase
MSTRVTRILCGAGPQGDAAAVEAMVGTAEGHGAHAVVLVGDLGAAGTAAAGYRDVFRALGAGGLPAFWVPGPGDAPIAAYLREAHNAEVLFTSLRGVHRTAAFAPGEHVLFAGVGGEISDDPDTPRDEEQRLRYARWEAEYALKILGDMDAPETVLLFTTPPAHKGSGAAGSEVLAELIATYRARLAVTAGERGTSMIGRSLVVAPGSLAGGQYAVADLHEREAELQELTVARS